MSLGVRMGNFRFGLWTVDMKVECLMNGNVSFSFAGVYIR